MVVIEPWDSSSRDSRAIKSLKAARCSTVDAAAAEQLSRSKNRKKNVAEVENSERTKSQERRH